jgi:Zn-dependent peptidase ImmA (M78 family)
VRRLAWGLAAAAAVAACRGEAPRAPSDTGLAALVDSLRPGVERAAGLRFKSTPRSAMRSKEQVRRYLTHKLRDELPPARVHGIESAYRLFGMLPDTLQLERLLVELYSEQVAGYYDPDSTMLFGVTGADPAQLRLVLAHEMVHALQGQYLPLDSIMKDVRNNDRLAAAQAVLEGQATLVSIRVLTPGGDLTEQPEFWDEYRAQVAQQQSSMPIFAKAPLVLRETLLFPYIDGAEFIRWWATSPLRDSVPYGPRMPRSTEQILHPDRYLARDEPVRLRFTTGPAAAYEDMLGELEIRVLQAQLRGADAVVPGTGALGWGGDLYRLYDTPNGPALVWYVVWDDAQSGDRFLALAGERLRGGRRPGYRVAVDPATVSGRSAARVVIAPERWSEWAALPTVEVVP